MVELWRATVVVELWRATVVVELWREVALVQIALVDLKALAVQMEVEKTCHATCRKALHH